MEIAFEEESVTLFECLKELCLKVILAVRKTFEHYLNSPKGNGKESDKEK